MVSIILPTYNCKRYLSQAVDSVIAQTYSNWELFIIDDCSTDNTASIIATYTDRYPNIHYIRLETNSGPAKARNEGLQRAKGKYIAFLDGDDMWVPEKLEKQIGFMERNDICFSATGYKCIDEDGVDLHIMYLPKKQTNYREMLFKGNIIGNSTVIYNQEALGKFFVPDIKKRNDFALWLQILKKVDKCYGMEEVLGIYRKGRKNSISSNKIGLIKYHWILYHNIEKQNVLMSFIELIFCIFYKTTGLGLNKRITNE